MTTGEATVTTGAGRRGAEGGEARCPRTHAFGTRGVRPGAGAG